MHSNDETDETRAFNERNGIPSQKEFERLYLNEPMGPNDYNGGLPPVPRGFHSWRELYARALAGLAKHNPAPWHDSFVQIEYNGQLMPPIYNDVAGLRYTEIAHYAAREQAAEDAEAAPFNFMELRMLVNSAMLPKEMMQRLNTMMDAAYRREHPRRKW